MRSFIAVVALVVVAFAGCKPRQKDDPASLAKEDDKEYARLVAGKSEDGEKAMEARAYLAPGQAKNGLWKTSREQTLKWAEELYQAGAAKVYAVYSPADADSRVNMCARLLVELPAAGGPRPAVLAAYNKASRKIWGDDHEDEKDLGQRFLMLDMDP